MSVVVLEGLRPWLIQRLSALYLVIYSVFLVVYWGLIHELNYSSWMAWLSDDIHQVFLSLFYLSMLAHAWVGIRDVLLDYIKPVLLRMLLLFAVAGFLFGCSVWMLKIILSVGV